MSYLISARKWRPQLFKEIIGQKHIVRTLTNALKERKMAQAYLFCGMRGVGKTTTARILAKALNCEEGISAEPCNACVSCKEITNGIDLDVLEIDGASNTSVDNIRDLRENIKYAPSRSRHKIYIIDEVHMLSDSAFNALLKTLEEPPAHVIFIFATTEMHKIPDTILSRCQCFEFKAMRFEELVRQLKFIVDQEKITIEDKSLALIARAAEGSLRDGEMLMDQVIAYSGQAIREEDVLAILGLSGAERIGKLVENIIDQNPEKVIETFYEIKSFGIDPKLFCRELIEYIHLLVLGKISPSLLDVSPEMVGQIKRQGEKISLPELQTLFEMIGKTEGDLRLSIVPEIVLEMALIKLTFFRAPGDFGKTKVSEEKEIYKAKPAIPESNITPTPPASFAAKDKIPSLPEKKTGENFISFNDIGFNLNDTWDRMKARVSEKKIPFGLILERGQILSLKNKVLEIGFPEQDKFYSEQTEKVENISLLKEAVQYILGEEVKVKITTTVSEQPGNSSFAPKETFIVPSEPSSKMSHNENIVKEENAKYNGRSLQQEIISHAMEVFNGCLVDKESIN